MSTTISYIVTDGQDTWLESQTFQWYSVKEARHLFKQNINAKGWRLAQ